MRVQLRSRLPLLVAAFLLAGCQGGRLLEPAWHGPFFEPRNHLGDLNLGGIRRVVLLPIHGSHVAPEETLVNLEPVLVEALQREMRFEVVPLSRQEIQRRFATRELSSAWVLPATLLSHLREAFGADAVLFVDLTVFSPYRPLAQGWRARLALTDSGRMVWSFDEVFAANDPAVVNSVRRHLLARDQARVPVDASPGVLQSPTRFAGYAAATMFATLPPVLNSPPLAGAFPLPLEEPR